MIYIYSLREPASDAVRYVGMTVNLTSRLSSHWGRRKSADGHPVSEWMATLANCPEMDVLEGFPDSRAREAEVAEAWWIGEFMRRGSALLNERKGVVAAPNAGPGHRELAEWAAARGLTQASLGNVLGRSQGSVSKWLLGSMPSLETRMHVQNLTGIPWQRWEEI